jgi:uncharacterized membrane protein
MPVARTLVQMNRSKTLFLALLMLLAAATPLFALSSASGPRVTLVDFTIQEMNFGNASVPVLTWTQSDGSEQEYGLRAVPIQVQVTFKQGGESLIDKNAIGYLQIWHPVGTLMDEWNVSLTLTGGESFIFTKVWTPTSAHSVLDDAGDLSGGYIVRAVVDAGLSEEKPENDVFDKNLPIAIAYDQMDRGATSSTGAWGRYTPGFASIGYEAGTTTQDGYGPWRLDNSSSADGTKHWRHSVPLQNYESMANDWLIWGWFVADGEGCDDPGHGLGYGIGDNDLTNLYAYPFCRVSMQGYDYLSMQLTTLAYGGLGSNDEVVFGATSSGTPVGGVNLSTAGISGTTNDWTRVIWNMTGGNLATSAFSLGFHFMSDNSGATAGFHLDQWLMFGVEKVEDYTITLDCDNPETGYIVIPADPLPPSLHCFLTNNGYKSKTVRITANIDNDTWMNYHSPIRIDSDNINDHDYSVPLNPLPYGATTEFWINLTIPDGSNVEELNWTVNFTDAYVGTVKATMNIPISVAASYSVNIKYIGNNIAADLLPSESGMVKLTLTNTGNQMAYWNLNAYFDRTEWSTQNIRFLNASVNGSQITYMQLQKAEVRDFWVEFTAPTEVGPGLTEVTIVAQGQSPANAQMSKKLTLSTPQAHNLELIPSESVITAQADKRTRTIEIDLMNNGNADDRYDLELTADWRLEARMSQPVSEEVGAFGDSSTVLVILPMPYGLRADTYFVIVKATSQADPTYFVTTQVELVVEDTYLIDVSDLDMTGQSFVGGADSKTASFEVTNNGNGFDEFTIVLDVPAGMNAVIILNEQYNPDSPPSVDKGASVNITIEYWFDEGTFGLLKLVVTATSSQSGGSAGDSGEAFFQVGSQGWLELTPGEMVVLDSDGWIYVNVSVHNRHPTNPQLIRLDVDAGEARNYAAVRVKSGDTSFVLNSDDLRTASIKFSLTETQFINLPQDEMVFNITVTATGTDDVASTVLQVKVIRDSSLLDGGSNAEGEAGFGLGTWLAFIFGGLVAIGLIVVLVQVVLSTNREEEEISTLAGYQSQLEATYGSVPAAPSVPEAPTVPETPPLPSTDSVANSPYGGAAPLFEQQVSPAPVSPPSVSPPAGSPPAASPPAVSPPAVELPEGVAELPPGGMPNGWTMEQWAHYGHEYRQQKGLD